MNNNKSIIFASLIAVALFTFSGIGIADAYHASSLGKWSDPNVSYWCSGELKRSSLNHTANVDPCGDISDAVNHWNKIRNSNLSFTEETTQQDSDVKIYTHGFKSKLGAIAKHYSKTNPFDGGMYIHINENHHTYGDISAGDSKNTVDYESLLTHEFGHIAGLDHNANRQSVMYKDLVAGADNPNPNFHDVSVLRVLY